MILFINTLLFGYGMALSCVGTLLTSQPRRAQHHKQRRTGWWTRHLSSSFLPRGICSSAEPEKTKPVFSLREPLLHLLLILLKRETLYRWERNSIFATEVTVLFVQHGFEILQTFQKPESQVSYLPSHLQWYVFWFWNRTKNSHLQMNVFKFPQGKHICTVQNQKTTLRKRPKALSILPDTL